MAVTVKKIVLWRSEIDNRPGILANALEPLAKLGIDLQVVMGYRFPGNESRAAIELYPVTGKKTSDAAKSAGLKASTIPTLLIEGDNRPGLGFDIAKALGETGINLGFLVAQVMGRKYLAVIGFDNEDDSRRAAAMIKRVTAARKSSSKAKAKTKSPAKAKTKAKSKTSKSK
jgi:hypothetical protein